MCMEICLININIIYLMKNKSTEKAEDYALSANSKLSGLDFSRAMGWASKIYTPLKQNESWLCKDAVFRRLKKHLLELCATNYIHAVGSKKMCGKDIAKLKKWRVNNYRQWNEYLHFKPSLRVNPKNGEVVLALDNFTLEKDSLIPRACAAAMRFYLIFLNEEDDTSSSVVIDELVIPVGGEQNALEASFTFGPVVNGCLLLLGAYQLHLIGSSGKGSFASCDRRYYGANMVEAIAVREGIVANYEKKAILPDKEVMVPKVAWVKRSS